MTDAVPGGASLAVAERDRTCRSRSRRRRGRGSGTGGRADAVDAAGPDARRRLGLERGWPTCQPPKSPMTSTSRALGAHTAKQVPPVGRVGAEVLVQARWVPSPKR